MIYKVEQIILQQEDHRGISELSDKYIAIVDNFVIVADSEDSENVDWYNVNTIHSMIGVVPVNKKKRNEMHIGFF